MVLDVLHSWGANALTHSFLKLLVYEQRSEQLRLSPQTAGAGGVLGMTVAPRP